MSPRRRQSGSDVVAANRPFFQALGRAVAARRAEKGLTQYELAVRCDVQPSYVSAIETASRNATIAIWLRVAKELDWKLSELFEAAGY